MLVVLASDTRPVRMLETWGQDLGMSIFSDPLILQRTKYRATKVPFVFLDVDRKACRRFVGTISAEKDCLDLSAPPADFLHALIDTASAGGPAAIILDFPLPWTEGDPKGATFVMEIDRKRGPRVIVPANLRPEASVGRAILVDRHRSELRQAAGRVFLAAFVVWTGAASPDNTVRGYAPVLNVRTGNDDGEYFYLPSAPFLAALLASGDGGAQAANAIFYRLGSAARCPAKDNPAMDFLRRTAKELLQLCEGPKRLEESVIRRFVRDRLVFSVRSLSVPGHVRLPPDLEPDLALRERVYHGFGTAEHGMLYKYYRVSDLMDTANTETMKPTMDNVPLKDAIVLIGSSSPEAMDWHTTPIGRMTGTEVIINAARAFTDFDPLPTESSKLSKLLHKLGLTAVASAVLFPFLFLSELVVPRRRHGAALTATPTLGELVVSIVPGLTAAVILMWGLAAATVAVLWVLYLELDWLQGPYAIDFLIPVIAVAFEGVVELSRSFMRFMENFILAISGLIAGKVRSLRQYNRERTEDR